MARTIHVDATVSKNDVADTPIEAAIGAGVHGRGAIVDLLQGLGFTRGQVAILPEKGADAASIKWTRRGAALPAA